jgi:hypothetical protein
MELVTGTHKVDGSAAAGRSQRSPYPCTSASLSRYPRWLRIIATVACVSIGTGGTAAAAGIAPSAPLAGQLVTIGRTSLTIQARGGSRTITTSSVTGYYQVTAVSANALALGMTVGISTVTRSSTTAATVTVAPTRGNLVVFAHVSRIRGSGGSIGGGGGSDDGGIGGGGEGDGGRGGIQGATGKITAIAAGSITIQPIGGTKTTMTLNAATKLYRVVPITRARLRAGSYVATRAALGTGTTASDVVEAVPGITISIGAVLGASIGG